MTTIHDLLSSAMPFDADALDAHFAAMAATGGTIIGAGGTATHTCHVRDRATDVQAGGRAPVDRPARRPASGHPSMPSC